MPTLTIKDIPEDLYIQLKRHAQINRRSINHEAILCLKRVIRGGSKTHPEVHLARARQLREKTTRYPITDDEFNAAKVAGRP